MSRIPSRVTFVALILTLFTLPLHADDNLHFPADRPVDIGHIKLDLRVDLNAKRVDGRAMIDATPLRSVDSVRFDAVDFDCKSVKLSLDGKTSEACEFENDGSHITLLPRESLQSGKRFTAEIDYVLREPKDGLHFYSPSEEDPEAPVLMWSQGEAVSNRNWVPCFDNPNEKQTTEMLCTVEKPNIAVSNGRLLETKENSDGTRTFHWLQDQPHAAYLITLVVGDFVSKKVTWHNKPVIYYVREKFKDKIDNSFAQTPQMLEFFSQKIGVEYPWDKYVQICCYGYGGGMENTSATTLGEGTLHDDRAHLDTSSDGLVAHELAHQWWGDLLTCRDWAHLWLNEGFASYFEALWDEHDQGADEFAYNMYEKGKDAIEGGKDKPIVDRAYDGPDDQFDSRAYPKGAWVLHMIRRQLGDELFWKSLNAYCTKFNHQSVETADFRKTIEDVTGRSFGRFFYDWTERPGSPEVEVTYEWLPEDKIASVKVVQKQKTDAFEFPLKLEFRFDRGEPTIITKQITEKRMTHYIPLASRPTMFRVDPDQAVLMTLSEDKPRDLWVAQLIHDDNAAARIRAALHFGKAAGAQDIALLADQLPKEKFWAVQKTIAAQLGESKSDAAREALLAGLAIKHPKARAAVAESLGKFENDDKVADALKALVKKDDPSYTVEAKAIESYAAASSKPDLDLLKSLMDRDSEDEIIRAAALAALGRRCDDDHFQTLLDWAAPGQPEPCRRAAVRALSIAITHNDLDPDFVEEGVRVIGNSINGTPRFLQMASLRALDELGPKARAVLKQVDEAARTARFRNRNMAKRVAAKIRGETQPAERVNELEKELAKLREENQHLRERVEKLEARSKKSPEHDKAAQKPAHGPAHVQ